MYFNEPSAVLDKIDELIKQNHLHREVYRQGGRGSKRAGLVLRKMTVQMAALGKHFRDLSTAYDENKRNELAAKFAKKWAEREEKKHAKTTAK